MSHDLPADSWPVIMWPQNSECIIGVICSQHIDLMTVVDFLEVITVIICGKLNSHDPIHCHVLTTIFPWRLSLEVPLLTTKKLCPTGESFFL